MYDTSISLVHSNYSYNLFINDKLAEKIDFWNL